MLFVVGDAGAGAKPAQDEAATTPFHPGSSWLTSLSSLGLVELFLSLLQGNNLGIWEQSANSQTNQPTRQQYQFTVFLLLLSQAFFLVVPPVWLIQLRKIIKSDHLCAAVCSGGVLTPSCWQEGWTEARVTRNNRDVSCLNYYCSWEQGVLNPVSKNEVKRHV